MDKAYNQESSRKLRSSQQKPLNSNEENVSGDNEDHEISEDNSDLNLSYSSCENSNIGKSESNSSLKHNKTNTSNNTGIFKFSILGLVVFVLYSVLPSMFTTLPEENITIESIQKDFPMQPKETLETIEAVINDVMKVEPIHPAVFLFIFDSKSENEKFISAIAEFASSKVGGNNHVILDEFGYNTPAVKRDFGYLIQKYKPILDTRKVMIVKNLHKMPGKTAQALHSFCDEITPLVDRAVYILTLKVDSFTGSEVHTAEKQLYKIWSDLKTDLLAPLITRVTSTVIRIH